jgi:hypothetical protein
MKLSKQHLRLLDIQDLYLMKYLLEGYKYSGTSKLLHIGIPAISHRVRKYRGLYGEDFCKYAPGGLVLSPLAIEVFTMASKVIEILEGKYE